MTFPIRLKKALSLLLFILIIGCSAAVASITRTVSDDPFYPTITLEVTPTEGTEVFAIEESIEDGALPSAISDGGIFDFISRKIKWGPFLGDKAIILSYKIIGNEGEFDLSAMASYDGTPEGPNEDMVELPEPTGSFIGQKFLETEPADFVRYEINPNGDFDENGVTDFVEYIFGLDGDDLTAGNLVSIERTDLSGETYTVRAFVKNTLPDVVYELQISENFTEWQDLESLFPDVTSSLTASPDNPDLDEITFESVPLTELSSTFIRVQGKLSSTED